MNYLYGYLAIGAALMAIVYFTRESTQSREGDILDGLFWTVDSPRNKWWWKPLNNIVMLILTTIFVALWPMALYFKITGMIEERRIRKEESSKEFALTKDHLHRRRTVAEIESAEVVMDPLGAVPKSPFGHLNPAWEVFKQSILESDELWSFSVPWTTQYGRNELHEGYVVMRGEKIGPHFLSRLVLIDE